MSLLSILMLSNRSTVISELPTLWSSSDGGISAYFTVNTLTIATILLILINYGKRKSFNSAINRVPHPRGLPLLGNLIEILTTKDILAALEKLSRENRPCYRMQLGPVPVVFLTAPESVEKLLSSNEEGHMVKADEYSVLGDYFDEGLVTSHGEKWRARRKLFSPLFNYKCFPHFLEVFNRHTKHMIHELDKMFLDGKAKPLQIPIYESALKIICETAMGVELNDTSEGFDKFFEEAERTKEYIFQKITRPWYRVKWIWKIHPFRTVYETNMKYIRDYIFKVIVEARERFMDKSNQNLIGLQGKNKTVMDVMLENGMSDSDIREEAHTVISAGHETTAVGLQFALMLLAQYPEHQIRCQKEIDDIITDESKCPNGDFTLSSLSDLRYTERCIKETLRLYPIAYLTGRKLRSPLNIDEGLILPSGTTVVVAALDIHMDPEIYPEPKKFDPDRFLPELMKKRHPYAYLPFSGGPRICLGYKFAMAEMKLFLARILYHFDVHTTDRIEDVELDASIVLTPVRGYNFILKRRNPLPDCH